MRRVDKARSKYSRYDKPQQEISKCLKYLIFFVNVFFVLVGHVAMVLGVYLYAQAFRPVLQVVDFFLNPAVLLISIGCLISAISLLGCMGSLRENVCMLKMFALCLFFCYILLVVLAFIVFILFYSDADTGVSIHNLLLRSVADYHGNENHRDIMDYLQSQLKCCGVTSQGYKDWAKSPQFNCSTSNPLPERCGVPYSCCKPAPEVVQGASPRTVGSAPNNPVQCWKNAQQQALTEVQDRLYTDGCLQPLQKAFEGHAVIIGAVVGAIIIPVCLSVTFSNILAKQVERQRYLLDKEARRDARRRKRERQRFRDPFSRSFSPPQRSTREHHYTTVDETGDSFVHGSDVIKHQQEPQELRAANLEEHFAENQEPRQKKRRPPKQRPPENESRKKSMSSDQRRQRRHLSPSERRRRRRKAPRDVASTSRDPTTPMRKSQTEPVLSRISEDRWPVEISSDLEAASKN